MSLPSKIVWFPLASGAQEGTDPRTAPPGTLAKLKNAAWTKDGLLDKRAGIAPYTVARSDAGSITSAKKLATRNGELLLIDNDGILFSYSTDLTAWVPKGQMPEVALTWESFAASDGIRCADTALTSDGKVIEAWISGDPGRTDTDNAVSIGGVTGAVVGGRLYVRVLDKSTGVELARSIGTAGTKITMCRVVASGTAFAVIYGDTGGLNLLKSDLTTTVALVADTGSYSEFGYAVFDAVAVGSAIIVGTYRSIATTVRVTSYDFAGVLVAGPVAVISAGNADHVSAIGLHATAAENLFVVVGNKSNQAGSIVQFAVHDPATLAQTLAPVTLDATASSIIQHVGVTRVDATHANVSWSALTATPGSVYMDGVTRSLAVSTAGATGSDWRTWFTRMLSRPFTIGSRIYMFLADTPVTYDTASRVGTANTIEQQYPNINSYLVAIDEPSTGGLPHRYVGRIDPLISGSWQYGHAPLPFALSATETRAVLPYQTEGATDGYQIYQGVRRTRVLSGANLPLGHWATVELGGEAHFAGAVLTTYDSIGPFDTGFPRPSPFCVDDSQNGSGLRGTGGSMVDGTYIYQTVPLFVSGAGLTHRGPPSPPIRIVLAHGGANDNKLRIAIIDQTLGCKRQFQFPTTTTNLVSRAPRHEIYRSEVGLGVMHRRTIEPGDLLGLNVPFQQPNISLTDTKADASISSAPSVITLNSRALIYTDAELEEIPPPSSLDLHLHKNRLFVVAGNEREVWVSKDYTENPQFAPGFNPDLRLVFEVPVAGVETCDDKAVFFGESTIFYTHGDGPAANGDGSDYSPNRIQTDVGCINVRSLVSMPDGIMFQSARGIYLLRRNLELAWVGKAVRDTLAAYPNITSAVLIHSLNQVRFTCNNDAGDEGVVLVFDHVRHQWSVFEYSDGSNAALTPIADAILVGNTWHFVTPGGQVYSEDLTTYLDDGEWVTADVETTEIFAEGPLGYQRVRRAYITGERFTDCDVTLRVAVDSEATYDDVALWSSGELAGIGSGNVGIHVGRQKNASFRFRVTDAAPSTPGAVVDTGRGVNLSAFGFEIAPKRGMDKRSAEARK